MPATKQSGQSCYLRPLLLYLLSLSGRLVQEDLTAEVLSIVSCLRQGMVANTYNPYLKEKPEAEGGAQSVGALV